MSRSLQAVFLSIVLAITSIGFAVARGETPDIGREMVICTGYTMIVVTIGPDGQPVEKTQICPDALSIFADSTFLPAVDERVWQVSAIVPVSGAITWLSQSTLTPLARGPPLDV